VESHYSLAQYQ